MKQTLLERLAPCPEESKRWDTTQNLYIEGDNLEVLKVLERSYAGQIKMIYIDPPYNTGNDFIYNDKYADGIETYLEYTGQKDDKGNDKSTKKETSGSSHSNWLSMMYPRLEYAKRLLSDDGVIFISIDDNEQANLKKLCDLVFLNDNFVSQIIIQNNPRGRQSDSFVATVHEYLLCYSKDINNCKLNGMSLDDEQLSEYKYSDEYGNYRLLGLRQRGSASLREDRPDMYFPIYVSNDGKVSLNHMNGWNTILPKKSDGRDGRWMWGKDKCKNEINRLVAKKIEKRNEYDIFVKDYLNRNGEIRTTKYKSIWNEKNINNQVGTQEVKKIFSNDIFQFPKSHEYLKSICEMGSEKDSIILDFFSGSGTTAHSLIQLNAEKMSNRKYIMVQLPEPCNPQNAQGREALEAGFKNIAEIGKERIRRAGAAIKKEHPDTSIDIGFKVFKLDSKLSGLPFFSQNTSSNGFQ